MVAPNAENTWTERIDLQGLLVALQPQAPLVVGRLYRRYDLRQIIDDKSGDIPAEGRRYV